MSSSYAAAVLLGESITNTLIQLGEDPTVDRIVRVRGALGSDAVALARAISTDGSGRDTIIEARRYLDFVVPHLSAGQLSFEMFAQEAEIRDLQSHGRAAEVLFRGSSLGFVDASDDSGLRQMHQIEVNNALYVNTPDNGIETKRPLPSMVAILAYPEMRERFPLATLAAEVTSKEGYVFSFNEPTGGEFSAGFVDRNGVAVSDAFGVAFGEAIAVAADSVVGAMTLAERIGAVSSAELATMMSAKGALSLMGEAQKDPAMIAAMRNDAVARAEAKQVYDKEAAATLKRLLRLKRAPLTKEQLATLRADAKDPASAAQRKGLEVSAWELHDEKRVARDHFELGTWLHYFHGRVGLTTPEGFASRVDCLRRILESGINTVNYNFHTVFDFSERAQDTCVEMGDSDEVLAALREVANADPFGRLAQSMKALGWDKPKVVAEDQPELSL